MSDKTESQPTEKVTVVEEKVQTEKKPNVFLAVLATILVMMLLIIVLGFFFFKANFKDTKEVIELDTKVSKEEPTKQDNTSCEVSTEVGCKVTNTGWALFSLPEIKFSAEIPADLIEFDFNGTELTSRWITAQFSSSEHKFTGFGPYVKSVSIRFSPFSYNEVVCGGPGCAGESFIDVDVFKNTANKTLDELWTVFESSPSDPDGMDKIKGTKDTKWGVPVYKYTQGSVYGEFPGYLLVKNGFVYQVTYILSPSPTAAHTSGEKIVEFMQFN